MIVGVVGLGIMGSALVQKLLSNGYEIHVYNRSIDKTTPFEDAGAIKHNSPAKLASKCDIVISFVTNADAVKQISYGENGILQGLSGEAVHCDMSTINPFDAREIAEQYRVARKRYVQAPVLGSKKQIIDNALLVFAGGNQADVAKCRGIWNVIAKRIWEFDDPGKSATVKLSFNTLIASMIGGLGQSIALAGSAGIKVDELLDILGESALNSPMYQSKGKAIAEDNFEANFYVRNLLKDVNLAAETADVCNIELPINSLMHRLLTEAVHAGLGNEDYSAVVKVIAKNIY